MSIKEFHCVRRMFLIREGTVILGPPNSPMSHRDWFESIGLDGKKTIEECVRGFVDDRGLFFYTGKDFNTDEKVENELIDGLYNSLEKRILCGGRFPRNSRRVQVSLFG